MMMEKGMGMGIGSPGCRLDLGIKRYEKVHSGPVHCGVIQETP